MSEPNRPRLSKWPFWTADLILTGLGGWVFYMSLPAQTTAQVVLCVTALVAGAWAAWLGVMPFVLEHRTADKLTEVENLTSAVAQVQKITETASQLRETSAQAQIAQEASAKSVEAARQIADRMSSEAKEFFNFLQKANDQEKAQLRLELDKLRRSEAEWLQLVSRVFDHIYALNQAASRSGQPALIAQLGQFQNACRDLARRVGFVPFVVQAGQPFDAKAHQLMDEKAAVPDQSLVAETLATGYTYQGQVLRRALVSLQPPADPTPVAPPEPVKETGLSPAVEAELERGEAELELRLGTEAPENPA